MIENETQYRVCEQLARLTEGLAKAVQSEPPADVHPVLWRASLAGMRSQIESLEGEIAEWKQKNA